MSLKRILALDHGSHRIGIAWSDALLLTAQPGTVLQHTTPAADLEFLRELCAEREVGLIVVGLPLNMDSTEGPQARKAREFSVWLEQGLGLPVETWDERLTSSGADEVLDARGMSRRSVQGRRKRKAERDAIAASLLLAGYLDANRDRLRERFASENA